MLWGAGAAHRGTVCLVLLARGGGGKAVLLPLSKPWWALPIPGLAMGV